jgi:MoaA/NifB/PqqE/SkfB family radical SAM enzyme
MIGAFAGRMLTEVDARLLWKFAYTFGWKGMRAVQRFERRGRTFPAFLFLSVTNRCNLRCQGCWVTTTGPAADLSLETMDAVVRAAKGQGSYFFGILGGEPLLHAGIFDLMRRHPDCYFQLFTNGTLITDEVAATLRALGNVTPLVSVEGDREVSDRRRGGQDVYRRSLEGIARCRRNRLVIGVATSVCQSNIRQVLSPAFLDDLIAQGVHYFWPYVYRPVGADPSPELALTADQILELRRFLVEQRARAPIMLVDSYWDHEGRALCPAAVGISHLVNPHGDVEPCPVIQFSRDSVAGNPNIAGTLANSAFLRQFREVAARTTRGCILLEQPATLLDFLQRQAARDTSGRGVGFRELAAMTPHPCHHLPGQEIPERHWLYRFAKKHWFFGFGAYG